MKEKLRHTMAVHFGFYFILLLWLTQAAAAAASQNPDESYCMEECGGVQIPPPFGIKAGCYNKSWFQVTCNKTAKGQKPFISRINLEIVRLFLSDNAVTIKIPVTSVNCSDKDTNGATGSSAVNLTGTPFFFSSKFNIFGSVGCGNLATISRNQTNLLGGCVQPRCGNDLSSEAAGCLGLIPENLTSYTVSMEAMEDGKRSCTSAFVFDRRNVDSDFTFPDQISNKTKHVFATLEWNPVDCDLKESLCQKKEEVYYESKCEEKCGNVDIPYPFGIKGKCYKNDWFRVTCNATDDGLKPFISSISLELHSVSFSNGSVLIRHPVAYFNNKGYNGISANLTGSPFYFSDIQNAIWSSGCGKLATVFRSQAETYPIGGCLQPDCGNTETSSNAGCRMMVPPGLSSFVANMTEIDSGNGRNRSDGSIFVIDLSYFNENMTIISDGQEITNWTHVKTTLQWGIPKRGLCQLNEDSNTYNCSSDGKYCWSDIGSNHLCVCSLDFNSNDYYSTDICQETSKCQSAYNFCYMLCLNTPGNYCSSTSCPVKFKYASKKDWCVPMVSSTFSKHLVISLGFSTSIGTIFVLLGPWSMYKVLKRRKNTKHKQRCFERNGGLLLQQQLSSNEGNVEKIRLFTSKELKKATDHYNENRILGQGGQATVYKGMLADGSIVAIKKPKIVEEKKIDEKKLEQFINEVIILSQINHRNVVKLLGCCLETEVPLLVYEFIPNGTLFQLIQDQNDEFPVTWKMRLRIAIEIANALCYLHSAASVPIYHRDIKSSNILLDDKYRAKVSDFGISRAVAFEQTHLTTQVQGTFGYVDPEYFRSSQFTEKSDVYSFGVVLVELLTGQKPISSRQSEQVRSLANFFLLTMKENSLFDILDQVVLNDGPEEEIIAVAKLAKRCLNLIGKKRPTMKEVAMELERIRASEEANAIQQSMDEDSDSDIGDGIEPTDTASC